jgi:hypothetical protein
MPSKLDQHAAVIENWLAAEPQLTAIEHGEVRVVENRRTNSVALDASRSPSLSSTRAREALMMAGAGGAMRATGRRATAIGGKQGD